VSQQGKRHVSRVRIDRSMIGAPTNFRHTGHIGSSDVEMGSSRLHAIHGQMQSKGGYEATIEVIILIFVIYLLVVIAFKIFLIKFSITMSTTTKFICYLGFSAISQNFVIDYNYYLSIHGFEFAEVNFNRKISYYLIDIFFFQLDKTTIKSINKKQIRQHYTTNP